MNTNRNLLIVVSGLLLLLVCVLVVNLRVMVDRDARETARIAADKAATYVARQRSESLMFWQMHQLSMMRAQQQALQQERQRLDQAYALRQRHQRGAASR